MVLLTQNDGIAYGRKKKKECKWKEKTNRNDIINGPIMSFISLTITSKFMALLIHLIRKKKSHSWLKPITD